MAYDLVQIKTYFLTNKSVTLVDVAKVYKIDHGYLKNISMREHWYDERREIWGDKTVSDSKVADKLGDKIAESIAEVKVRHAKIGKTLQNTAIRSMYNQDGTLKIEPKTLFETTQMIRTGIMIERDALGMNEKEVKDEIYQQFSQYMFIFNLKDDELQRFIKSIDTGSEGSPIDTGETVLQPEA